MVHDRATFQELLMHTKCSMFQESEILVFHVDFMVRNRTQFLVHTKYQITAHVRSLKCLCFLCISWCIDRETFQVHYMHTKYHYM